LDLDTVDVDVVDELSAAATWRAAVHSLAADDQLDEELRRPFSSVGGGRFLPRTPAPERTTERQKLAEAIEYLSALDRQLKRLAEARGRLGLRDKERAHATARRGLDEARQRAPEALVAKMMGEAYDSAQTVDHAQGLLEDTQ
jgi:hypothetical protein